MATIVPTKKKVIVLLVENGCAEHLPNDELCKALAQHTPPPKPKKSKKKAKAESLQPQPSLHSDDMVVITRADIELVARVGLSFFVLLCLSMSA